MSGNNYHFYFKHVSSAKENAKEMLHASWELNYDLAIINVSNQLRQTKTDDNSWYQIRIEQ